MCFGGGGSGKSAEDIYQERKPVFGPLPSLREEKVERKKPKMADVRVGQKRRNLLNPTGLYNAER